MNCIKKKALLITAGFLGVGGYILYQNLKTRIDDLEEEIWGMEDAELEVCPYCERVYTIESGINNDVIVNVAEVKYENSNNELHDEVQNHLKDLEEQNKNNNELHDEVQNHLKDNPLSVRAWRIPWTEEIGGPRGRKESDITG